MSLKVGIIGLEGHQGEILRALPLLEDTQLVAIASRNQKKLDQIKSEPMVDSEVRTYTDYHLMLKKEKLDIVSVCNIDNERAQVLKDCACAGLHIVSEKPLVNKLEDLEEVRKVIEANQVHLSMLLTMRFSPSYRVVKEIVERGEIGEVILATAQKSYKLGTRPEWMKHRESFSGIIPFIGIHSLDLIRWTSGREFSEVIAYHSNVAHPEIGEMEDNATLILKMDNGGSASVRLDYLRPPTAPTHGDDALRLAGSQGIVEVTESGNRVALITLDKSPHFVELPPEEFYFVDFVASLRGERKHLIQPEEVYAITEICLKARDAADRGEPVSLK